MEYRLLSSFDGAIDHLLLCVPGDEALEFAGVYGALVDSLPLKTKITILAQPMAQAHIDAWPCAPMRRERLNIIDAGDAPMTSWACDLILAGVDNQSAPLLLATPRIDRLEDARLPAILTDNGAVKLIYASDAFEGGNILLSSQHIFIGADSPAITVLEADVREVVVIAAPECPPELSGSAMRGADKWQEVFHYHNTAETQQPIFHIDMFMTLAGPDADGREQILVGDPLMAAEILDTPLHPLALATQFDAIAEDLTKHGFSVIRNPLPMIYMDKVAECRRTWFYASSNNVLLQRSSASGNIVWLAEYGHDNWPELAKTDAANRELWQSLGYEVRMIGGGQRLAENLGGLHCLTNVLKRG